MSLFDVATATVTSILRGGLGRAVAHVGARPRQPLEIYEFEGCPFCRKVREALSILDLDVIVHPCPKNGTRYREAIVRRGGKAQFPYLVDPNTGKEMYESGDIVDYLFAQYGTGKPPAAITGNPLATLGVVFSGIGRGTAGTFARSSMPSSQRLELYSFEPSPFCRLVRETLCELELPYLLHNVAKGSAKREAFVARSGKMQVPYLVDPNTGTEMFESAEIIAYLNATYGSPRAA